MSILQFELGKLVSSNPRLRLRSSTLLELAEDASVSYPENSHALLAEIEPQSYWFNHRNDIISSVVKQFLPPGPIYDIGGGNGYVSLRLRQDGHDPIVIEPGPRGAAAAVNRGLPVVQAAFQKLNIPEGSIPAAGLFDVLEHIEDDLSAIKNLFAILVPGGRLYLTVPAHNLLWSREDEAAGHYRRYSVPEIRKLVAGAGFEIEFASYFFSMLVLPILIVRAIPTRLGIRQESSAKETAREHSLPDSLVGRFFQNSFKRELAKIGAGKPLRFGASCLLVARKI